ncbi:MAG TPA: DUF4147 domain-containing protein [Candidatus Limnocylindrales bacterium]|nr:DUF4147 domain-containing protein [Candidatus Limnocylindrales bacterium]
MSAWTAGLRAVDAESSVRRALAARPDLDPADPRTLVVAAGKAAAGMLRGLCRDDAGAPRIARAIAVLPSGADIAGLPSTVEVLRGGHPYPTAEGRAATLRVLESARTLGDGDRLLVLLSGGASALLEAPAAGVDFESLAATYRALVASGLAIRSINLIRGCLSAVKAGRLAAAAGPARTTTFAISDVEGDDPAVIGSGPTVEPVLPVSERCRRALDVVADAHLSLPPRVLELLRRSAEASEDKPGQARFAIDYTVIASIGNAIGAARDELARAGYRVIAPNGGERLYGDTSIAAARIAEVAGECAAASSSQQRCAVVFGGETTVAVPPSGAGRGGRNLDVAARVALHVRDRERIAVISAGTDGVDGSSRAAGAIVDGGTSGRCEVAGFPLAAALEAFDTEPALDAAGDLVVTGPTGTNVGDLTVVVTG